MDRLPTFDDDNALPAGQDSVQGGESNSSARHQALPNRPHGELPLHHQVIEAANKDSRNTLFVDDSRCQQHKHAGQHHDQTIKVQITVCSSVRNSTATPRSSAGYSQRTTANPCALLPRIPTPPVTHSAVEGCQMGSDCPCAVGGAGGSGVHNQVVDDALMYAQCLQTSHPANPVRPVALSYGGDLKVATDSYPHHRKACQGCRQPLLRRTSPQEDFIEDETCPRTAYRCQTRVPGRLGPAEVLSDDHGPDRSELDGACSAHRPAAV